MGAWYRSPISIDPGSLLVLFKFRRGIEFPASSLTSTRASGQQQDDLWVPYTYESTAWILSSIYLLRTDFGDRWLRRNTLLHLLCERLLANI